MKLLGPRCHSPLNHIEPEDKDRQSGRNTVHVFGPLKKIQVNPTKSYHPLRSWPATLPTIFSTQTLNTFCRFHQFHALFFLINTNFGICNGSFPIFDDELVKSHDVDCSIPFFRWVISQLLMVNHPISPVVPHASPALRLQNASPAGLREVQPCLAW